MKTRSLYITLLIIILTTGIVHAEEKPEEQLSNTRQASVTLRITTDPKTNQLGEGEDYIKELRKVMFSPEVVMVASEESLETSDWPDLFSYKSFKGPWIIGGIQTVRVDLAVSLTDQHKPAAKEFLEAHIKQLRAALTKEFEFARGLYMKKHGTYAEKAHQAEMHLAHLLNSQNNISGRTLDKESVRQQILEHERALIENDIQQAILNKRADVLAVQISNHEQMMNDAEAISAHKQSLQVQIDQLRNDHREVEQKKKMLENSLDLDEAQDQIEALKEKLSDIEHNYRKIDRESDKLREREQRLRDQADESLRNLNHELRETTMRLEELEIEEQYLRGYRGGSLSDSMKYEMLEIQIEAAKENLHRALIEKSEYETQLRLLQEPTISYGEIICSEKVTVKEDD